MRSVSAANTDGRENAPCVAALFFFRGISLGLIALPYLRTIAGAEQHMSKAFLTPSGGDDTAAFLAAALFQEIEVTPGTYRMEGQINILPGQLWRFDNATIYHTDNTKVMFSAIGADGWAMVGAALLQGTLTTKGSAPEKALHVIGCNKYRVQGIGARCFLGIGFHLEPGTFAGFKADQGQWSDCYSNESMVGLQVDAGSGAEYNLFSNFSAIGNIVGVQVGAGNTTFLGGNITENTTGVSLVGGANDGHGSFVGTNINHNGTANIVIDGVTNGFDFAGCHIYDNGPGTGIIHLLNATTDVAFNGGRIDAPVVHDASGSNRVFNAKLYSTYSVSGSNPSGWIASGCY
jgi:hypothetical protein